MILFRFSLLTRNVKISILFIFTERNMAKKSAPAKDSLIRNPDVVLR